MKVYEYNYNYTGTKNPLSSSKANCKTGLNAELGE
jgi:hypothetical protein